MKYRWTVYDRAYWCIEGFAVQVVSHAKIRRLANLSKRVRRLRVVVDDAGNLREIARVAAVKTFLARILHRSNCYMPLLSCCSLKIQQSKCSWMSM